MAVPPSRKRVVGSTNVEFWFSVQRDVVMFVDMGAIYVHANMAYVDVSVDRTNVICGDHVDVIYANVDHVDVIYVDHTDVIDIVYQ